MSTNLQDSEHLFFFNREKFNSLSSLMVQIALRYDELLLFLNEVLSLSHYDTAIVFYFFLWIVLMWTDLWDSLIFLVFFCHEKSHSLKNLKLHSDTTISFLFFLFFKWIFEMWAVGFSTVYIYFLNSLIFLVFFCRDKISLIDKFCGTNRTSTRRFFFSFLSFLMIF